MTEDSISFSGLGSICYIQRINEKGECSGGQYKIPIENKHLKDSDNKDKGFPITATFVLPKSVSFYLKSRNRRWRSRYAFYCRKIRPKRSNLVSRKKERRIRITILKQINDFLKGRQTT